MNQDCAITPYLFFIVVGLLVMILNLVSGNNLILRIIMVNHLMMDVDNKGSFIKNSVHVCV